MRAKDLCVLIPSLEPDGRLTAYVEALLAAGFGLILVVNDGSGTAYDGLFDDIARRENCHVLRHESNRGKGQALRTGLQYIWDNTALQGVVTADSDGQHTVADALKLADALDESRAELLLGSRDFSRGNKRVPRKSRYGNRITSCVFALLYGNWLPDTQTGLRAAPRSCIPKLLSIKGDRFEYEMNMLIECSHSKLPMRVIPIETIYLDENKGTHFHPVRDSWRVYRLLLGSFARFSAASILSFVIDYTVLSFLLWWVFRGKDSTYIVLGLTMGVRELIATPLARLCSAPVNFLLNRDFAFRVRGARGAAWRYAALSLGVLVITTLLFAWLNHFIPPHHEGLSILLKALIDTVIYLLNFRIQRNWVFGKPKLGNETEAA